LIKFPESVGASEVSLVLKSETNLRTHCHSTSVSPINRGLAIFLKKYKSEIFTCLFPTCFHEFVGVQTYPKFLGCKVFTQFPNTSPSGERVDSDDSFPQKTFRISVKMSPLERQSVHASPWNAQRSSRDTFWKLPLPPSPLYKEARRGKFISPFHHSLRSFDVFIA
jgi:hypothetical protein